MFKRFLVLTFTVFSLIGCVGTIESKKEKLTSGSVSGTEVLNYSGVENAIPVSHDKVEVTFPMMEGDNDGKITYVVKYNSLNSPKYFKAQDLVDSKDEFGNFRVTINDLALDQYYNFTVQTIDQAMNSSANIKVVEAKTFANKTADFSGISSLQSLTGINGAYGIRVNWLAAAKTGTLEPDLNDVINYEIKLIEEPLNPSAFDDPSVDQSLVKTKLVDAKEITIDVNGLKPDTYYYVRVRAIHHDAKNYEYNTNYKKEENNIFRRIKTFGLNDVVQIKYSSLNASSSAVSGTINAGWAKAEGPFREYRLYYGKEGEAMTWNQYSASLGASCSNLPDANNWGCKTIDVEAISSVISDLENYEVYNVALVACVNTSCSSNEKYMPVKVTPDPVMANFQGITGIENPRAYYQLDTIFLKFNSPDFTSGVLSGLFVKFMGRNGINPSEPQCILNNPEDTCNETSKLSISPFDFATDNEIAVSGIDPESEIPYCFKIIPYIDSSEGIQMADEVLFQDICTNLSVALPTLSQFKGLEVAAQEGNFIKVEWLPPTGGIYKTYHLILFRSSDEFDYRDGLDGKPGYVHTKIDYGVPTLPNGRISRNLGPIDGMNFGEKVQVGIILSKESTSGIEYSLETPVKEITWQ